MEKREIIKSLIREFHMQQFEHRTLVASGAAEGG